MNCAALRPAVMKTVDWGSNSAASRKRLLLSAPHKPLSAQDDGALVDFAYLEQRMAEVAYSRRRFTLDTVQRLDEWTSGKSGLLRLAHL